MRPFAFHGGAALAPTIDYPETTAGVVLWLDARQPKYQDLAGTIPAGNGQPVRRADMRVPLGQYASAASDAARPLTEGGALNYHPKDKLTVPASGPVPGNDMTFALGFSLRDGWYGSIFEHSSGFAYGLFFNGPASSFDYVWDWIGSVGFMGSPAHTVPIGAPVAAVVRITPTTTKVSVVVGGVRSDYTFTRSNPSTPVASGGWLLPGRQAATRETQCAINQFLMWSRAITDVETTDLLSWLTSVPAPDKFPTDTPFVGVHGDSIAASLGVSSRLDWWTVIMQESLCTTANINMYSSAVSGDTIAAQRAWYLSTMRPLYNAARAKNILVNAVGINNMRTGGQSAATAWGEYFSFLDLQLADGFLPIACTVQPTTSVSAGTTDAFNALVRANWASRGWADIADPAAVPGLMDPTDHAIYPDELHPSAAGNVLMAPEYAAPVARVRGP